LKYPNNLSSLERIQSAICVLCLDDTSPVTREEVGLSLWAGNFRNRFYDKSLQFIVFENGKSGFLGEHSMMDATPNNRMCDFILKNEYKTLSVNSNQTNSTSKIKPIAFQIPEELYSFLDAASMRIEADISRHEHKVLPYSGYGKNLLKKYGVSPDAYVQLSIQLAYFKLFGISKVILKRLI
jgi:carnitine O-acetyltransferase